MAKHKKTLEILEEAVAILQRYNPMTLRQLYYQLVSRQVMKNDRSQYQALSKIVVQARLEGTIRWEWIEDRTRRPRHVSMWSGLTDFASIVRLLYRRNVWDSQPGYLEVWLEKDALSGIFADVLRNYGVTLNVGRGYDGWDSIHNAAERFAGLDGATILYFGDFDPSGEDMVRSLRDRLAELGARPAILKCALTLDDIQRYNLPPDFTKSSDTRQGAFVERYGDVAVELDALPLEVLRQRLVEEVETRMDLAALEEMRRTENEERERLVTALSGIS